MLIAEDIEEIHNFVMSKDSFSPSEVTAIAMSWELTSRLGRMMI